MSESAAVVRNPFMLMLNPEFVLAAIEKSERLGQLNRHLCRPLDRQTPAAVGAGESVQTHEPPADVDSF
ncbi:MAG: hypothetical protein LH480_02960 [Rubrivivax sp.]|nr:hypothetical protein [Rubrivivax sp.]